MTFKQNFLQLLERGPSVCAESISLRCFIKCNKNQDSKKKSLCSMILYVYMKHICMQITYTHFPHTGRICLQLVMRIMCDENGMGKEKLIFYLILLCAFEGRFWLISPHDIPFLLLFNLSHLPKVTEPGKVKARISEHCDSQLLWILTHCLLTVLS